MLIYWFISFIYYSVLAVVSLFFIIISYIKSPIHLDIYLYYKEKIENELIISKFYKYIYIDFIDNYKNYKKFYKNKSIIIYIFSGFILCLNIIRYKYVDSKIKNNKKIDFYFFFIFLILYTFIISNFILIGKLADSHYYIKLFVYDLMKENEIKKFKSANDISEKYEIVSYYLYLIYMISFCIIENILIQIRKKYIYDDNLRIKRINKCKKDVYNPLNFSQTQICSICQNSFTYNENILILPCKHIFHFQCIDKWIEKNNTCPIDRKQILN